MSKPITQPILFQLGAAIYPLPVAAKITNIKPLPPAASVYGNALAKVAKPDATTNGTPRSIIARMPPDHVGHSANDWDRLILNARSPEEGIAAIVRAGQLRDAGAVEAIMKAKSIDVPWVVALNKTPNGHLFWNAASDAIMNIGEKALPTLIAIIENVENIQKEHEDELPCRQTLHSIEDINKQGCNCRKAIPALLRYLEATAADAFWFHSHISELLELLYAIGGKGLKNRVIESLQRNIRRHGYPDYPDNISDALKLWNIPDEEIDNILDLRSRDLGLFSSPLHRAAHSLIAYERDAKRMILERSAVLKTLADPQSWITVNDPALAREALELVATKAMSRHGKLDNALGAALGVRMTDIEHAHYTFYADEILDVVSLFVKQSKLTDDPEVHKLMDRVRYGDDIKLRYIRRDATDVSLGGKCGDCTSKGSIHFGDSMTWFINPAYQIIKMSKGKRFIGKIHITLGSFGGKDAIIVDAIEFNPQAQEGKPYYDDGVACFIEAMGFLKDLARRQKRQLFALRTSNSLGALGMLGKWSESINEYKGAKKIAINLIIPHDEVKGLLKRKNYEGEIGLYYQMLGESQHADLSGERKNLVNDRLPILEREVVNPAQISSEDVAAAMRARDFDLAAKYIVANARWNSQIKTIFAIPSDIAISPAFLAKRLEDIYRGEAIDIANLKHGFIVPVESFTRIATD